MQDQEQLRTAADVAAQLQITQHEVYRLAQRGRLPSIKLARRVLRFRPEDVEAFIEAHRREAQP